MCRVPSTEGLFYFKASSSVLGHEAALTNFLAQTHPQILPKLLAVDLERGWMLMRGSGAPLRMFIKEEKSLARWKDILPVFVRLQKDLVPQVEALLSLHVPDRRIETLPKQFERLIADKSAMLIDQEDGLTAEEYRKLRSSMKSFRQMIDDLASLKIPATLHHDDFHDGNLFLKNEQVRFTDWGESAVAHPFFTLVVLLRGAENTLDLAPDAPELAQMRAWYLEQWADLASPADLRRASSLAERIGLVNRALTWHMVISSLPESQKPEYAPAVPAYLQDFLNSVETPK
ncbi:MAG: hypothetical protein AB9897_03135 [Anaerolineaceae bacterium]